MDNETDSEPCLCLICQKPVTECDCTVGPQVDIECFYEPEYGHQMGCPYYGIRH